MIFLISISLTTESDMSHCHTAPPTSPARASVARRSWLSDFGGPTPPMKIEAAHGLRWEMENANAMDFSSIFAHYISLF